MSNKDLSKYTIEQLHKIARHYNLSGYESMGKPELIKHLSAILDLPDTSNKTQEAKNAPKQLKEKYRFKKLRNDSGIIVHRNTWKYYGPRILLMFLLAFELITFLDPLITHFVFNEPAVALSSKLGSISIGKFVGGRDWGIVMGLSALSFAWTTYIFYGLIRHNTFNNFFFVSILLGAGYFFYYLFSQFEMFKDAQKFINSDPNALIIGKFKELLAYYWAIVGLSTSLLFVPLFVITVNVFTNKF